jgi:basic membrane protein A
VKKVRVQKENLKGNTMRKMVLVLIVVTLLVTLSFSFALAGGSKVTSEEKEAEAEEIVLGMCYNATIGDMGWVYAHDEARAIVVEKYPWVTSVVRESIATSDMYTVASTMIEDQGADIIIMNSAQFIDVAQKVAKDYPDVMVVYTEGFKRESPNVAYYFGAIFQPTYLTGLMAGALTKTNKIGFVAAMPLPQVNMRINAMAIGAREVNPDAKIVVKWTNSWFDPPTEGEVASALIAEGCDVMAQHQNSPTAVTTAAAKKLYSFGYDADMSKFGVGPDGKNYHISAPAWHWSVVFEKMIQDYRDGKNNVDYWSDMSEGMVDLSPINRDPIPPKVMELVERRKQEIMDGTFEVFHGPLYRWDNNKLMVPEGEALSLDEIRHIDWFVKNVVVKLP